MTSGSLTSTSTALPVPTVAVQPASAERLTAPIILADQLMDAPLSVELSVGKAALFSRRGPTKDTANEDVACVAPLGEDGAVLIVADGLGGHADGEEAAQLAVETILDYLVEWHADQPDETDHLRAAILNGIEAANEAVLGLGTGAATTLALVEIQRNVIRPYHVGDSAIILMGQRGRMKLQTIAHSPIGYAVESGLIAEEEAMHHEDRHMISNVIGSSEMRIEIGPPIEMAPRDRLLLASDGLLDNLLPEEIVNRVRTGPIDRGVQRLATQAIARMSTVDGKAPSKPDDLTIVAFCLR